MTSSQRLLAAFFVLAGALHFLRPREYEAMMPPYVPRHRRAVAISGAAEIAGGIAVMPRSTRRAAGLWLLTLLVVVFPANLDMAVHPERHRGLERVPRWALWARLPLQPLIMIWAWRATR
jgi:uncharacterized membrane protein